MGVVEAQPHKCLLHDHHNFGRTFLKGHRKFAFRMFTHLRMDICLHFFSCSTFLLGRKIFLKPQSKQTWPYFILCNHFSAKNMELHCKVILLFLSGPVFSFNDFLRKVKARRPMFRNPNIKVWVTAEAKASSRCCSTSTNGFSMVSSATFYHSSSLTMRHDAHSLLMCWYSSSNPKYTTVLGSFANEDQCRKSQFCHWQWLLMEALF